jgi:hypothetical protein
MGNFWVPGHLAFIVCITVLQGVQLRMKLYNTENEDTVLPMVSLYLADMIRESFLSFLG